MSKFFAHSLEGRPVEEWQPLEEHLLNVAKLAAKFAKPFSGEEWARIARLLHDMGKYSKAFQQYLGSAQKFDSHEGEISKRVDHSSAGAQLAVYKFEILRHLLTYIISGHHTGLLNGRSDTACLEPRLHSLVKFLTYACAIN